VRHASSQAFEALKGPLDKVRKAWRKSPTPRTIPQALAWSAIAIDEKVFQRRGSVLGYAREALIDELTRALRQGATVDPVTVWWAGKWFLVDGHHRMAAWKEAIGPDAVVPVRVLQGSLSEALAASVGLNYKTKLRMTKGERTGAAWFLTVHAPEMTKAQVMAATGTSEGTVAEQRRVLQKLEALRKAEGWQAEWTTPADLDWESARAAAEGRPVAEREAGDWKRAGVAKIQRSLAAAHGKEINTNPEMFLEALAGVAEQFTPEQVAEAFGWAVGTGDDDEDGPSRTLGYAEPVAPQKAPEEVAAEHAEAMKEPTPEKREAAAAEKEQAEAATKAKHLQITRAGFMQEARRHADDPVAAAVCLRLAIDPELGRLGNTMTELATPAETSAALLAGPWAMLEAPGWVRMAPAERIKAFPHERPRGAITSTGFCTPAGGMQLHPYPG
jgi:hypothetical protein